MKHCDDYPRWLYRDGRPTHLAQILNRALAVGCSARTWPKRVAALELRAAGGHAVLRHGRRESIQLEEVPPGYRPAILRRHEDCDPWACTHVAIDRHACTAELQQVPVHTPVLRARPRTDDGSVSCACPRVGWP